MNTGIRLLRYGMVIALFFLASGGSMILVGNEYELNRVLQASAPNVGIIHIGIVLGWFIIFLSLSWDSVKQVSEEAWR